MLFLASRKTKTIMVKKEEMTFFGCKQVNAGNLIVCWVKGLHSPTVQCCLFSVKGSYSLVWIHSQISGKFALKHLCFASILQSM